jgi:hypothetical protein
LPHKRQQGVVSRWSPAKAMATDSSKPPSQSWRTSLADHRKDLVSIDLFVASTATFRVLFVSIVLAHHRRGVARFNGIEHPPAAYAKNSG